MLSCSVCPVGLGVFNNFLVDCGFVGFVCYKLLFLLSVCLLLLFLCGVVFFFGGGEGVVGGRQGDSRS